jgi:hypothetical protein
MQRCNGVKKCQARAMFGSGTAAIEIAVAPPHFLPLPRPWFGPEKPFWPLPEPRGMDTDRLGRVKPFGIGTGMQRKLTKVNTDAARASVRI